MNYSTWIEEKHLKKTFIVATLCSTIVGTFTTTMNLYDAVQQRKKQRKTDDKQDGELQELRKRVEKAEQRASDKGNPHEDYGANFQQSSALIQRQYDEGYGRLGSRFAMGDTITENQLQKQIIALQQTVITILQDALYNDRPLTRQDMAKLAAASDAAREGSIDALRAQQSRLTSSPHHRYHEDARPLRALPPPNRAPTVSSSDTVVDDLLFCPYALDLQSRPSKPLSTSFAPSGISRCPDCDVRIDAASSDLWTIGKRGSDHSSTREFQLGQRFVVKCHMSTGEYACVLCARFREKDAVCRSVEALVNHVGRCHGVGEFEGDSDLREVVGR